MRIKTLFTYDTYESLPLQGRLTDLGFLPFFFLMTFFLLLLVVTSVLSVVGSGLEVVEVVEVTSSSGEFWNFT